jgi:hypothetical protein
MNELIATCSNALCKHVFQSGNISVGNNGSGQVTINSPYVGVECPKCGKMAYLSPGTYSMQTNVTRLLSGPRESFEVLQRVKNILEAAAQASTTKEEVIQQVAAESSAVAGFLQTINADSFQKWLTQVIAILGLAVSTYAAFKPSDNDSSDTGKQFQEHLKTELYEARKELATTKSVIESNKEQVNAAVHVKGSGLVITGLNIDGGYSRVKLSKDSPPLNIDYPNTEAENQSFIDVLDECIKENRINNKTILLYIMAGTRNADIPKIHTLASKAGYNLSFAGVFPIQFLGSMSNTGIYFVKMPQGKLN